MVTVIIFLVLLIALELTAIRWGFDSRDKLESLEWQRRTERGGSSI